MERPVGRRAMLGGAASCALAARIAPVWAQTRPIRIGVLTEMSGPNTSSTGPGSVLAARMAVEDATRAEPGLSVEVLSADHQARADIALQVAREWLDERGVDVIVNVNNSAAALAVADLVRQRDRVALFTAAASSDLTGASCGPNHVQWTYDTWALGNATGGALTRAGGDTWFIVGADYTFGHTLAADTERAVLAAGGKVVGRVFTPYPDTTDFSAFLLQAQASGARVIGLANSGTNTTNCIKQAHEFGLTQGGTRLAAMLLTIADVHALGLEAAQGLTLASAFYWDLNDGTRAFARRFATRLEGCMPTMFQAGDYSAVTHYLKVARSMGTAQAQRSGRATVAAMKAMPTEDPLFGPGVVRADGRKLNPMFLFQVKAPAESHDPWDCYRLLATIPEESAFRPMQDGRCPMLKA
ncbi:MAG: ABC transporter substrate-binding protein [Janthinobacterium lividum]